MIIDINALVYFHLDHPDYSEEVATAIEEAGDCYAPNLWRSELCNTLRKYVAAPVRESIPGSDLTRDEAVGHMEDAEQTITLSFAVRMDQVLTLSLDSGLSPYDCEYVQLGKEMGLKVVTYDQEMRETFPDVAISPTDYLQLLRGDL